MLTSPTKIRSILAEIWNSNRDSNSEKKWIWMMKVDCKQQIV